MMTKGDNGMKIEFLQSHADITEFVDYLYDNSLHITWKDNKIENWKAKQILYANLIRNVGGNFRIGNNTVINLLEFDPCDRASHPRYINRSGRYAGRVCELSAPCDPALSAEIFKTIDVYFKQKYVLQRVNPFARFRAYFGPHYRMLEERYTVEERPHHICFGYILLTGSITDAELINSKLQNVIQMHSELANTEFWLCHAYDGFVQNYVTFLFDRNMLSFEHIKELANDLACKGHRICSIKEKLYEGCFSIPTLQNLSCGEWETKITVECEWKGFGHF
jgi:hypothetical protein